MAAVVDLDPVLGTVVAAVFGAVVEEVVEVAVAAVVAVAGFTGAVVLEAAVYA